MSRPLILPSLLTSLSILAALPPLQSQTLPQTLHPADAESALRAGGREELVTRLRTARAGEGFRAPLVIHGTEMTLDLKPHSSRSPDFRVELVGPEGRRRFLEPGPVRTFRGSILEIPGSRVSGGLFQKGLELVIRLPDDTVFRLAPASTKIEGASPGQYVISECGGNDERGMAEGEMNNGAVCAMEAAPLKKAMDELGWSAATSTGSGCAGLGGCVADILFDTNHAFYVANGSDTVQVQTLLEAVLENVNLAYETFAIRHRLTGIVIRLSSASDPYFGATTAGQLLEIMRTTWTSENNPNDLVHLFASGSFGGYLGAATSIGGVCGYSPTGGMYSFSTASTDLCARAGVVTHELGHSWGATHGCGMMEPNSPYCTKTWCGASLTEIPTRRDQVAGYCLEVEDDPPVAQLVFSCSGLACSFNAGGSTDDHGIATYAWDFGDAASGTGATASHTYPQTGSYTATLTVTDTQGHSSSASKKVSVTSSAPMPAESFFTVPPCRLADTRSTTALASGQIRVFNVTGSCNIPSTAKAVSLTATVVSPTGDGYLVFYPGDQSSGPFAHATSVFTPSASPRSNNAVLRLATDGSGTLAVLPSVYASPGQVHLVLDVDGYFSESAGPDPGAQGPFGFQGITPCRLADTRTANTPISAGGSASFTVQGLCGIPSGAAAAALNLSVVSPTAGGYATAYDAGTLVPPVASLTFVTGTASLSNGVRARLATATPDLSVTYGSSPGATSHVVLDAYGYFGAGALLKYRPISPCRTLDTRVASQGGPALAAGETRNIQIRGNCGVPASAQAILLNLSVVTPASQGYLTAFPTGTTRPLTAALLYHPAQGTTANGIIVPLSANPEALSLYTVNGVHVVADVFGYFQ